MCMMQCCWSSFFVLVAFLVIGASTFVDASETNGRSNKIRSNLFQMEPCPSQCNLDNNAAHYFQQQRQRAQQRTANATTADNNNRSSGDDDVRIFYLILIHNERTANDAVYLFRAIRHPLNSIVIHYDKKVEHLLQDETSVLLREIKECSCGSTVHIGSIYNVEWSKWSMNLPTLWGMEVATTHEKFINQWDVFVNLSGDTMPVYTPIAMTRIMQEKIWPYNFITSRSCETGLLPTNLYAFPKYWHKRRHYTRDEQEPDVIFTYPTPSSTSSSIPRVAQEQQQQQYRNKTITIYFGSQWVILQQSFVQWLVQQLDVETSWPSQLRDYLTRSQFLMTDETFIPTVLMHANTKNDDNDDYTRITVDDDDHDDAHDFSSTLPLVSNSSGELLLYSSGQPSGIRHVRFERMDEHVPTSYGSFPDTQRYQVPETLVQSGELEQPKVWGPYFLGVYDLGRIRESGALYIRKVSALVDPNMIDIFPVNHAEEIPNIHWPTRTQSEISLSPRRDWQVEMDRWNEYQTKVRARETVEETSTSTLDSADNDSDEEL